LNRAFSAASSIPFETPGAVPQALIEIAPWRLSFPAIKLASIRLIMKVFLMHVPPDADHHT
jgi:hypothetical protein